jgi:hypothetical protein
MFVSPLIKLDNQVLVLIYTDPVDKWYMSTVIALIKI